MDTYARSGPHLAAIKEAARHQYFSESMFARFIPTSIQGRWKDRDYA
jgi:spheroidene monooxygenase